MNNDTDTLVKNIGMINDSLIQPQNQLNDHFAKLQQPLQKNNFNGEQNFQENMSLPFRNGLLDDTQESQFMQNNYQQTMLKSIKNQNEEAQIHFEQKIFQNNPNFIKQNKLDTSSSLTPLPFFAGNNFNQEQQNKQKNQNNLQLRIVLDLQGKKSSINNAPLIYKDKYSQNQDILVLPILEHIVRLGEKIEGGKVLYYSNEENMNVLLGIYGSSIDKDTAIDLSEVERKGQKVKILLFVEMPSYSADLQKEFNGQQIFLKNEYSNQLQKDLKQNEPQEAPMIAVSVPQMETESQMINAIDCVTEPIKKEKIKQEQNRQDLKIVPQNNDFDSPNNQQDKRNGMQSTSNLKQKNQIFNEDIDNDIFDDESKNFDTESQKDNNSYNQSDNYQENESSQNSSNTKKSELMRPKRGGVNNGKDKKCKVANIKGGNINEKEQMKRRTKERTITDIIEKVSTWRKLYNGVMVPINGQMQLQRWSLEDAALKVQVSKKSLDDYLLQLRFGKKFDFDFEKHRDSKVGVLRTFVKQKKKELQANSAGRKNSQKLNSVKK